MAQPRSDPAKHLDHGFALPVCQEKERPRTEDRDLVMRTGIELNCGHSSHLVNLPLGDNEPHVESVICSPWGYRHLPLPGFQSIISRLPVARRVPERQRWRDALSPRPRTGGVDHWQSREPPCWGIKERWHLPGAVKSKGPCSFMPSSQSSAPVLLSLESKVLEAPPGENLHNLN